MALKDYTWDELDDWARSTRLDRDEIPGRVALTAPLLVTDADDPGRILLVDPHPPGTWETWMFPYASLVLSAADIRRRCGEEVEFLRLAAGDSLARVSESLVELRDRLSLEYRRALSVGYNNVLPHLRDSWGGDPVYRNFSLKFSNTSDSYTAYVFDYHRTELPAGRRLSVPHVWVRVDEFAGRRVDGHFRFQDRKISSNVPEVLDRMAGAFPL
ncbi:hypothetical protein [Kutzneria sp. NPDC052558]|uniref:hypothetical protein n=1 Tax=Kutzneria sp. NPDC052558 TaxID=3364121 RepID=UPI0037CA8934